MPSLDLPKCPRNMEAPPTQLDLDFADLAILDLSKAHTPEGRAELAPQLRDALHTNGFVYAINHGYTQAQRDRIFDIATVPFEVVPPDEMKNYLADIERVGSYAGFKGRGFWKVGTENDIRDQIDQYNLNHDVTRRSHPEGLRPFLPEIDAFVRHNHFNILHPILRMIALTLELPEETLVEKQIFEKKAESGVTFIKYLRRTEEDEEKSNNVWIKGHTDIGSITLLWSQPVSGLQIFCSDGKWRWVRHMDNAVVVNSGDMLNFLTGGYYKPTIHRVVQPPRDQSAYDRLAVIYFTMADDDVKLCPLINSPVLQRVGIERQCPDAQAPLSLDWRKERTISYGRKPMTKGAEKNTEEEIIEGIVVKHYN